VKSVIPPDGHRRSSRKTLSGRPASIRAARAIPIDPMATARRAVCGRDRHGWVEDFLEATRTLFAGERLDRVFS
jgi:hypothetical protein